MSKRSAKDMYGDETFYMKFALSETNYECYKDIKELREKIQVIQKEMDKEKKEYEELVKINKDDISACEAAMLRNRNQIRSVTALSDIMKSAEPKYVIPDFDDYENNRALVKWLKGEADDNSINVAMSDDIRNFIRKGCVIETGNLELDVWVNPQVLSRDVNDFEIKGYKVIKNTSTRNGCILQKCTLHNDIRSDEFRKYSYESDDSGGLQGGGGNKVAIPCTIISWNNKK